MSGAWAEQLYTGWRSACRAGRGFPIAALLMALLALLSVWGLWKIEISDDDTSSYFSKAAAWAVHGKFNAPDDMAFSPLYIVFFAWVQRSFPDPAAATNLQQILIVIFGAVATLAALRQILPRAWAWCTAAWWICIHWDLQYEVHLFGYAIMALGAAFAGKSRSMWSRGLALALLGTSSALVRNEFLPAAALFALCCGVQIWREKGRSTRLHQTVALLLPSIVSAVFFLWVYSGKSEQIKLSVFRRLTEARQRANLQQVYPFGYLQRHTDWDGDPWLGGTALMSRDFGSPNPTFREAFKAAPHLLLEHVHWNFSLLPSGLQAALFGCYSGDKPPDFVPVRRADMPNPIARSVLVGALWLVGAWLLWQWRKQHSHFFFRASRVQWTWIYLYCCLPSVFLAIATQRPRAAYILPLTLLLMAYTALAARLLVGQLRRRAHLSAAWPRWVPIAACLYACLALPFPLRANNYPQPVLRDVRRLSTLADHMRRKHRIFAANVAEVDAVNSFLTNLNTRRSRTWRRVYWSALETDLKNGVPLAESLEKHRVSDLYLKYPGLPPLGEGPAPELTLGGDWVRVALVQEGSQGWQYWSRSTELSAPPKRSSKAR